MRRVDYASDMDGQPTTAAATTPRTSNGTSIWGRIELAMKRMASPMWDGRVL